MRKSKSQTDLFSLSTSLDIRQIVNFLTSNPQNTLDRLKNQELDETSLRNDNCSPIERLAFDHLGRIWECLREEIENCDNKLPAESSILRFLRRDSHETCKQIVERYEEDFDATHHRELLEWKKLKCRSHEPIRQSSIPLEIPRLDVGALSGCEDTPRSIRDNRSPDSSPRSSFGRGNHIVDQSSGSSSSSPEASHSSEVVWSGSASCSRRSISTPSFLNCHEEVSSSELDNIAKDVTNRLLKENGFINESLRNECDTCQSQCVNSRKHGGSPSTSQRPHPPVLTAQFIRSQIAEIPSLPVNAAESCGGRLVSVIADAQPSPKHHHNSSRFSTCDNQTCRYVPKVQTAEVAVSTEDILLDFQSPRGLVDVGVGTTESFLLHTLEESSSSLSKSDLSAGQISNKMIGSIFQRADVDVMLVRGDGSVVQDRSMRETPSVRDWQPCQRPIYVQSCNLPPSIVSEIVPPLSRQNGLVNEEVESVSAHNNSTRNTISEEDSNTTLAHVSPLPPQS
ncbi:hypothetical protein AB6A40_002996 [Gnathostoma spinigerum]|uniref:Uncharacterized protein n=1 Tax=Gnathostoma spinigerum TaxID=75299 RepID=A0ABD6EAH5_9BILA